MINNKPVTALSRALLCTKSARSIDRANGAIGPAKGERTGRRRSAERRCDSISLRTIPSLRYKMTPPSPLITRALHCGKAGRECSTLYVRRRTSKCIYLR
ncbi:unnamed protein product [Laminaria digitata]